ncbi:tetratricopeptide repeat protein [Qipengyuania sp. MTN3-11]|uniref:tetratricopeptide repeat protein n=1 Tax=Qipengyuania sp. MTN3-11 TaxID=3056557 RepID=UPI0036F397A2
MAKAPPNQTREEQLARRRAAEEEALLREVDDAVRQGDMEHFGQRYGKPILALVVVAILAFGGYLFWQARLDGARERNAETLTVALDQIEAGNLQAGADALEDLASNGDGIARVNALLLQGGIASQQGNSERAAELFGEVAEDADAPSILRDVARIRRVAEQYEGMDKAAVVRELAPLAKPGQPFFGSAGELVAMAHLEQGNRREAGALFAEIAKAEDVPDGLRSRARQMAGVLGVDAVVDVEQLLEDQGVEAEVAPPAGQ